MLSFLVIHGKSLSDRLIFNRSIQIVFQIIQLKDLWKTKMTDIGDELFINHIHCIKRASNGIVFVCTVRLLL